MENRQEGVQKLAQLIKDIEIAMLTTVEPDGSLHSRPMATQKTEFDGDLWFFTADHSPKIHELDKNSRVNVSYADPKNQRYVAVSGRAEKVRDPDQMRRLWNPMYRAWFPKGLEDPNLLLLRIHVERAEYWDTPSGLAVHVMGLVKAISTGERHQPGDHQKLDLSG